PARKMHGVSFCETTSTRCSAKSHDCSQDHQRRIAFMDGDPSTLELCVVRDRRRSAEGRGPEISLARVVLVVGVSGSCHGGCRVCDEAVDRSNARSALYSIGAGAASLSPADALGG